MSKKKKENFFIWFWDNTNWAVHNFFKAIGTAILVSILMTILYVTGVYKV